MATLYCDFLWNELLDIKDNCKSQGQDAKTGSNTQHWGVQGVRQETFISVCLVLPRPENVGSQEPKSTNDAED